MNHRSKATILLGLALAACATQPSKPATCSGQPRRDANPHGSVLPGAPVPARTAPAEAGRPHATAERPFHPSC